MLVWRQYRRVEPRAGLKNRILAQLRATREASPPWARARGISAGFVAVGVVSVVVSVLHRSRPHATAPAAERQVAQSSRLSNSAAFSLAAPKDRRVSEKRNSDALPLVVLRGRDGSVGREPRTSSPSGMGAARPYEGPRQDEFPSPAPLSEQESLLVSYVRQLPEGALVGISRG
jgi:hypothetical protein